jgi:hypothetical protein
MPVSNPQTISRKTLESFDMHDELSFAKLLVYMEEHLGITARAISNALKVVDSNRVEQWKDPRKHGIVPPGYAMRIMVQSLALNRVAA